MGPRFCKRGNLALPAVQRSRVEASMGPRFCKRGNTIVGVMTARAKAGLQWGHAFVSVETHQHRGKSNREDMLQWGHAFVSVETASHAVEQVYHLSSPLRPEVVRQAHILAG